MRITILQLPDVLVTEILSRAPIKELGRCKCVCKPWRSLIGNPQFRQIYRSRDRGLILYWSETGVKTGEFRLYWSHPTPKRRQEEFRLLSEINVGRYSGECRLVNGLICVHESESNAPSIYSVCRGERMMVPEPLPCSGNLRVDSSFHLGFDPVNKKYKLLRLIFEFESTWNLNLKLQAHIITLQPSDSQSQWRKLDFDAAGICNVPDPYLRRQYSTNTFPRLRSFSGDGVLCWESFLSGYRGFIVFVVEQERFLWVKFPDGFNSGGIVPRAQFREQRLALILWDPIEPEGEGMDFRCFVLEDDKGEKWRSYYVYFPREIGVPEITLVNSDSHWDRVVEIPAELRSLNIPQELLYSDEQGLCCPHKDARPEFCSRLCILPHIYDEIFFSLEEEVFGLCARETGVLVNSDSHWDKVVKIPAELRGSDEEHRLCQHRDAQPGFCSRLFFLPNSYDHLYFSLDELLSGRI